MAGLFSSVGGGGGEGGQFGSGALARPARNHTRNYYNDERARSAIMALRRSALAFCIIIPFVQWKVKEENKGKRR